MTTSSAVYWLEHCRIRSKSWRDKEIHNWYGPESPIGVSLSAVLESNRV